MTKFKVGDKVRVVELDASENSNLLGRDLIIRDIIGDRSGGNVYFEGFSNSGGDCVLGQYLKLVESKLSKKQRIKALETNVSVLAQDAEIYKMRISELERQLAAQKGDYDRVMKLADEWARLKDTAQRVVDGATADGLPPFEIGDKVRLTKYISCYLSARSVYEVVGVTCAKGSNGPEFVILDDDGDNYRVGSSDFYAFEKATAADA